MATVLSGNVRREISSSLGAVLRGSGGRPFVTDDINGVGARQQKNPKIAGFGREKRDSQVGGPACIVYRPAMKHSFQPSSTTGSVAAHVLP